MVVLAMLSSAGCATPARIQGSHYVHLLYHHVATKQYQDSALTLIFIEGDGLPWVAHGMQPSSDPTPVYPLAYNLYKSTPYASWYLTRPCYNHVKDKGCTNQAWTSARYSESVVSSMVSAINSTLATFPAQRIILVGYSGGGTLATLIAPRVPQVTGVISIAGNLDINAWTTLHGYEPLTSSLNPANVPESGAPLIVLTGDHDTNVPFSSIAEFLRTHPHAIVEHFANNDHVCCWEKHWPATLNDALARLNIINAKH